MIFIDKQTEAERSFVNLLDTTRAATLEDLRKEQSSILSPIGFETIVAEKMAHSARGSEFEGHVVQTGAHAFPDIVANKYFGVEVKTTTGDKWISIGNSILETTRVEDVEKIFMFFGKFGGQADIKFRPYAECLNDIGVTHSPRYKIDMNLPSGRSIFDKMGVNYDDLRREGNPIRRIKDYYRSLLADGEELWWIDPQAEGEISSPIIKPFRNLPVAERRRFMVEAMILFPEIFGTSSLKFERAAAYLVMTRNAVSSNLRDLFTAGGKVDVQVKGIAVRLPKIYGHLSELANDIRKYIDEMDKDKLAYYWRTDVREPRIEQWKRLLGDQFISNQGITPSDVFDANVSKQGN